MIRNNLILCFFCATQMAQIVTTYQHVCFFNEKLCLEIPADWVKQDHYSKFSDYEALLNARCISKDNGSQVTVHITDKKYDPKRTDVEPRLQVERQSDSLRWTQGFAFDSSGIELRGHDKIGFIKYQFVLHGKKHYMIECLFADKEGNLYTVEIYSLILSTEKFKETAEHIYRSIRLN